MHDKLNLPSTLEGGVISRGSGSLVAVHPMIVAVPTIMVLVSFWCAGGGGWLVAAWFSWPCFEHFKSSFADWQGGN